MVIEQILVTNMVVFCYFIMDEKTKEGLLIDPAGDFKRIDKIIQKHKAKIKYIVNTHGHYDHTSGNEHYLNNSKTVNLLIHSKDASKLKNISVSHIKDFKTATDSNGRILFLANNDEIYLGKSKITVVHTPGHSAGSICLHYKGNIFTGDTLFTEGMGRTDFADGSIEQIYHSIRKKILSFPDNTKIWPGHHYGRHPVSTVKEQKEYYLR